MLIGIGCDIVQIPRIEKLLEQSEEKFLSRVFTQNEREAANKKKTKKAKAAYFAKRFAAKEAFAKALGTGFGESLSMQDVGVINDDKGAPRLELSERAQIAIEQKANGPVSIKLSLSDDYPTAMAFVVVSGVLV